MNATVTRNSGHMRINKILFLIFLLMVFSSVVSMFWLLQIDGTVKTLDEYGARYATGWLGPYSKLTVIAFGLLVTNTAVASFGLISRVKPRRESKPLLTRLTCLQEVELTCFEVPSRTRGKRFVCVEPEVVPIEVEKPEEPQVKIEEKPVQVERQMVKGEEPTPKLDLAVAIACPNCKRVFSRPLLVLDFSSGTSHLINVCPYCRRPVQDSNEQRRKQNE